MEVKNNNNHSSFIPTATAIGGIGGAVYGFRHPSEASCLKISKLSPTIVETMTDYRDSFNLSTAKQAVVENKLNLQEYSIVNDIVKNFTNTLEKEQIVQDILNTPIQERTQTLSKATKEANLTRPKLYKSLFKLTKGFKEKLVELNIFDAEKFVQTTKATKERTIAMYKELSKGAAKGLAIGIAAGVAIGYLIKSVLKNKQN